MKKIIKLLCVLFLFCCAQILNAQTVSLDSTFGENGIIVIPNTTEIVRMQFDKFGNIIVAGINGKCGEQCLSIAKVSADGVIDQNFGDNGVVTILPYTYAILDDFKITEDNKIFIVGVFGIAHDQGLKTMFMRLNEDGSFDETYGNHGKIVKESMDLDDVDIGWVNLENNDYIIFNGIYQYGDGCIVKCDYNGKIDRSFGENGKLSLTDQTTYQIIWKASKILKDRSIVVAGYDLLNPDEKELAVCKLTPDGNFVANFANQGIWKMNIYNDQAFNNYEHFSGVTEDSYGNIILIGYFPKKTFLCTLSPHGVLNSDFGTNGFYDQQKLATSGILQNGSKYLIHNNAQIFSINNNGTKDMSFNNTGEINLWSPYHFFISEIKLQTSHKLIVVGCIPPDGFSIARLNIPSDVSVKPYLPDERSVTVYPNPTTGELRITNYELGIKNIEFFDIYGRKQISDIRLTDMRLTDYPTSDIGKSENRKSKNRKSKSTSPTSPQASIS